MEIEPETRQQGKGDPDNAELGTFFGGAWLDHRGGERESEPDPKAKNPEFLNSYPRLVTAPVVRSGAACKSVPPAVRTAEIGPLLNC